MYIYKDTVNKCVAINNLAVLFQEFSQFPRSLSSTR